MNDHQLDIAIAGKFKFQAEEHISGAIKLAGFWIGLGIAAAGFFISAAL